MPYEIIVKVLPIIIMFFIGVSLKKFKIFNNEHADLFLNLIYIIALPSMTILSITGVKITPVLFSLTLCAICVFFINLIISNLIAGLLAKFGRFERQTLGVFVIGSSLLNISFTYSFVSAYFEALGIANASMFDLAGGFLAWTVVYYFACKYGSVTKKVSIKSIPFKKILVSPPLISIILALVLNMLNIHLNTLTQNLLQSLSYLLTPLLMISLGIYFNPKVKNLSLLIITIAIRTPVGFIIGLILANLFSLHGVSKTVLLICCSAPIGFNTLTLSSKENLDSEFASSLVSYSVLISLFTIPAIIYLYM